MPTEAHGWGSEDAKGPLKPITFQRRDVGPGDVSIKIAYCGVDHTDIHAARNEWGFIEFPAVVGHEIVGHVTAVGADVKKFKVGDTVGVGCIVDSCLECAACKRGLENYCEKGSTRTYCQPDTRGPEKMTFGGFSDFIVVREEFVLRIPSNLDLAGAAPLLCAGVTMYSPLCHWKVTKGTKLGVVGLGGVGHMAVKLGHAMGAEVTVFTTSANKCDEAKRLGAHHVVISKDAEAMKAVTRTFDLILDTVGVSHDLDPYLNTLNLDGTHVLVGAPENPHPAIQPFSLIFARRSLVGSFIGGIAETQEMLDFCGKHNIVSDVEVIKIDYINEAFERMLKSDVKYRFVVDMASLKK